MGIWLIWPERSIRTQTRKFLGYRKPHTISNIRCSERLVECANTYSEKADPETAGIYAYRCKPLYDYTC